MKEQRNKLIKDFYEQFETDMSYEEFEQVCKTPFLHLRRQMRQMNEVRFMYLGQFKISVSRVLQMLRYTETQYRSGKINEKLYNSHINNLITFVENNRKLFTKVKNEVKQWISL